MFEGTFLLEAQGMHVDCMDDLLAKSTLDMKYVGIFHDQKL